MSDAKHTPGPWKVVRNSRNCTLNVVSAPDADGESVKIALVNYQDEGNANLIAVAPDMRDEITRLRAENEKLREALEFYGWAEHWVKQPYKQSVIEDDKGRRARAAIEGVTEPTK